MFLEPQPVSAGKVLLIQLVCYGGGSGGSGMRGGLPVVFWLISRSVRTELWSLHPARCYLIYGSGSHSGFSRATGA